MLTSLYVSEISGVQHRTVVLLIKRHEAIIQECGNDKMIEKKNYSGGRPITYYQLSNVQAYFVVMLMKNSSKVISLKKDICERLSNKDV